VTSQKGTQPKPAVYLEHGIHAREWIAHATGVYILNALVTGYGNDTAITSLLDQTEYHIVPVVNVDGYLYTWTVSRDQGLLSFVSFRRLLLMFLSPRCLILRLLDRSHVAQDDEAESGLDLHRHRPQPELGQQL
jgi:murein tripeptide amidase MpaA